MEKTPNFPVTGKKIKPSDYIRHFHCQHYDTCVYEAAIKDRLLDCGACEYRLFDFIAK